MSRRVVKISFGEELRRITLPSGGNFSSLEELMGQLFPNYASCPSSFSIKWKDADSDLITISSEEDFEEALSSSPSSSSPLRLFLIQREKPATSSILLNQPSSSPPSPSPQREEIDSHSSESSESSDSDPNLDHFQNRYRHHHGKRHHGKRPGHHHGHHHHGHHHYPGHFHHHNHPAMFTPPPFGSSPQFAQSEQGKPHHVGVTCDQCNQPIVGIRYKCTRCYDFDLCETCEAKEEHPKDHPTLKIRLPTSVQLWDADQIFPPAPPPPFPPHHFPFFPPHYPHHPQQPAGHYPRRDFGKGGNPWKNRSKCHSSWNQTESNVPSFAPVPAPMKPEEKTMKEEEKTTPPPPSFEESLGTEHQSSLLVLEEMGFPNQELNLRLLRDTKGNLEEVISLLTQFSFAR